MRTIFEPVVKEVIALITGQIAATKAPVKAVLLVGGFGQNTFLRDSVRQALGNIEVMQSPNGYLPLHSGVTLLIADEIQVDCRCSWCSDEGSCVHQLVFRPGEC